MRKLLDMYDISDKYFKNFILNCEKLNIDILDNNNPYSRDDLICKISKLKQMYIKKFSLFIYKNYSNNNIIEKIEIQLKKLKGKISILDDLYNYLNSIDCYKYNKLFKLDNIYYKDNNVIEIADDLFINSDDIEINSNSDSSSIVLTYHYNNKNAYLAEYVN